ncbi:MAG TPA: cbb3-type cytochrome c oxidase N-terminal domain-containing protein [Cyclobacteriaceae bacterium]|nr:cbb3-type cytochrome c oxidase N-terminal domain-containing protein [Cyclobacteriaceae bacterium]
MITIYFILAFLVVTILLVIGALVTVVKVFYVLNPSKTSWWTRMWDQINASVPVAAEHDIDTGHEYDGIRELDNHLPPWWKGLFYATIVWGVIYLIVYHVTDSLPLSEEEYTTELTRAEEQARIVLASRPAVVIDENTLQYTAEPDLLTKGKAVFASNNCGSCHRNDGGGNSIGPNLTDEHWIHGGSVKDVFSTINKGVVEKGMPAWGKVMSQEDVRNVAFYIMSLKGSNPADAKAPQGELYKP